MKNTNLDELYFYGGELGACYDTEKTVFRVWSPTADDVLLKLYNGNDFSTEKMEKNSQGVWEKTVNGDLDGRFYNYLIKNGEDYTEVVDIYAKSCGVNGKIGMVVNLSTTNPKNWCEEKTVKLDSPNKAVLYELHVRDFSSDKESSFENKGKFSAFLEENLTNSFGDKIGIDHIKELGVTHVHLLPIYDYATTDELSPNECYNWGYDPQNYNIPEGSYSKNPSDGKSRIYELKELISKLHENNIGVVMDVVYNHTYTLDNSGFNITVPNYYYRNFDDNFSNGSACGNEVATERKMVRKFIVDSIKYWAKEYKLDGFRFDLMGLYDIATINEICEEVTKINPDMIFYGEGWTGGESPLDENLRAMKKNAKSVPKMAMFSDDFRDSLKGDVFISENKGFVNGGLDLENSVKKAMIGGVFHPAILDEDKSWTDDTRQVVNYVEAHDNLTLWDKLYYSAVGKSPEERIKMDKLSAAAVFMSQGIAFMQAGQEFLRSKPLPNGEFAHDSYKSPDEVNSIKWENKHKYSDVYEYYKGLIALRKSNEIFSMKSGDEIRNCVKFGENLPKNIVEIIIDGKYHIILNASEEIYPVGVENNAKCEVFVDECRASNTGILTECSNLEVKPISALMFKIV